MRGVRHSFLAVVLLLVCGMASASARVVTATARHTSSVAVPNSSSNPLQPLEESHLPPNPRNGLFVSNDSVNFIDPWGLEPGFGSPGSRNLTDEQKKELFGYDDEKLDKERQDDKAAQEALSDAMKDLIMGPFKAGRWVWKCVKGVWTRVWKETDPGESFPEE